MTKRMKSLLLTLSAMSVLTAGVALGGCKEKTPEGPGPRFLKGIDKEIDLGDGIDVGDYIDYVTDGEYTITISNGSKVEDITKKRYWQPEEPGVYTVTYTVVGGEFEGTNSFDLKVSAPKMTWKYTLINQIFDTGEVMNFNEYFAEMNITAKSYYPWKMVMDSVTVAGETTDLKGETSWKFTEEEQHVFRFHIEAEDGQSYSLSQAINVRYVDQEMLDWMDANEVTVDRALRLEKSGKVVLDGGSHNGDNLTNPDNVKKHSLPHLDFNGTYGVNDFVMLDFTGNNMPAMLFFGDEITDTPYYNASATAAQNKGFVIANGWTTNKGIPVAAWMTDPGQHMNGRLTVYGPSKVYKMSSDPDKNDASLDSFFLRQNFGARPHATSMYTLIKEENANTRFRVFFGFTEATPTQFTVQVLLVNLDKGEIVCEDKLTCKSAQLFPRVTTYEFTPEDYQGKIALYGMFGRTITLDKVHPVQEDISYADLKAKYCKQSELNDNLQTMARVGETLNVADFITPKAGAAYSFGYYDATGAYTAIKGNTFSFAKAGVYTLAYSDGENLAGKADISVVDIDDAMATWTTQNNVSYYNALSAKNGKIVLGASSHNAGVGKNPDNASVRSMSYVAFNGNYGLNDFLVFDFTGNNLPYMSFFNGEVVNSIYYNESLTAAQNKGFVLANGAMDMGGGTFTSWDGSVNKRLQVLGPNKVYGQGNNPSEWFRTNLLGNDTPLALVNLAKAENANRQYRLIIGFTEGTTSGCKIAIYFMDRTTGEIIIDTTASLPKPFPENYFNGSIALYSNFGVDLTLDQVYAIEQDTTMSALKTKYAVNA